MNTNDIEDNGTVTEELYPSVASKEFYSEVFYHVEKLYSTLMGDVQSCEVDSQKQAPTNINNERSKQE